MSDKQTGGTIHERFARAQSKFGVPVKDRQVTGSGSYKYADLASMLEAVREPLANEGLYLHQQVIAGEGSVTCITQIGGPAGDTIDFGSITIRCGTIVAGGGWKDIATPQAVGSAATYARKYGVLSLGIASDDDDGQEAAKGMEAQPKQNRGSAPEPKQESVDPAEAATAARKRIYIAASQAGIRINGKPLSSCDRETRHEWLTTLAEFLGNMPYQTAGELDALRQVFNKYAVNPQLKTQLPNWMDTSKEVSSEE